MRKQISSSLQTVLLAAIASIFLLSAGYSTFAQDAPKFKVGDRIKIPDHGAAATIVKVDPGWLTVKYDDMNGNFEIMSSGKITLLDANDKPVADNKAAPPKKTETTEARNNEEAQTNGSGEFKVGDRVKVRRYSAQEKLQPCTITRGLQSNSYQVRCDPWERSSYMDYQVLPEWVFPWENATAAPKLECSFDAPAGTVSNTAAPSAQLFKRVIYERMADDVKTRYGADVRYGMQFTTFQMGTPSKNVMTEHGLLKDSVLENAMFYPVKAQFKECREVINDDTNRFRVTKMNFGCYKNSFGSWFCGADSTPEFLEQQDVPKN